MSQIPQYHASKEKEEEKSYELFEFKGTGGDYFLLTLTNTFLALSELNLSLLELPEFLLNPDFRRPLVHQLKNENTKRFFTYEFPDSNKGVHQWTTPLMNKLGNLLFDSDIGL